MMSSGGVLPSLGVRGVLNGGSVRVATGKGDRGDGVTTAASTRLDGPASPDHWPIGGAASATSHSGWDARPVAKAGCCVGVTSPMYWKPPFLLP